MDRCGERRVWEDTGVGGRTCDRRGVVEVDKCNDSSRAGC